MAVQIDERKLTSNLNKVYNEYICLDNISRKDCVEDFKQVVNNIMEDLKKTNMLFEKLFAGIYYTGSYFDGLRVAEASEFDLDIKLRLPINVEKVELNIKQTPPGFIKVKIGEEIKRLRQHPRWTDVYRFMDVWVNNDGFIEEEKVRQWFESILSISLNKRRMWRDDSRKAYKVSLSKSGPAMTLNILRSEDVSRIDVDLVPVLQFEHPKWPNPPVRQCPQRKTEWFVVPKKTKSTDKSVWRLAFPMQEQEIFKNNTHLKPVLKMIKKLRDVQKWTFLSSYYIKTIFLWEVEKQRKEFWSQSYGFLFCHMLQELKTCLQKKEIPFFWNRNCNLLGEADNRTVSNAFGRLNNIMQNLAKDPSCVAEYLVDKGEKARQRRVNSNDSFEHVNLEPNVEQVEVKPADSYRCAVQ